MSNLSSEIKACGIICTGLYEGFPVTDPSYAELSPGDQAIVNACIKAHDKSIGDKAVTTLKGLLTTEQYEAYANVRNSDARNIREERHLREALPFLHKLIRSEFPDSDLDKKVKEIESDVALWDDTVEPEISTVSMIVEK
jgi:hypothetical protein